MSDRNKTQASKLASLKIGYLTQIEILLDDKLSDREKIEAFMEAASFDKNERHCLLLHYAAYKHTCESAACMLWRCGYAQKSLFAYMPNVGIGYCPLMASASGHPIAANEPIPPFIDLDWSPNRATLEAFMRVQLKARSKNGPSRLSQSN